MTDRMNDVSYLEVQDFNPDGTLKKYVGKGKKVVVMVQGNYCGHCKSAKPAYKDESNSCSDVVLASLQIDGEPSEKQAVKYIKMVDPSYRGVTIYLKYDTNGKFVGTHEGGRDAQSILAFARS